MIELLVQNGNTVYTPVIPEGVSLDLERKQAGKLTFDVIQDGAIDFTEGNAVSFKVDGQKMFYGFVFTKQRDKTNTVKVTAYDQMRYLKNKDTYVYTNKTASDLVRMIAADFRLQVGDIEDTGYIIPKKIEDNQTLLDMILNALDETLLNKRQLFVLYDDFGRLVLKNVGELKLGILIDEETGENFEYTSSIDEKTYNRVKLTYENEETGKREIYLAQDGEHINQWGVLQLFETIKNPVQGKTKAEALLSYYNQKTRKLQIKAAFGDIRVRAGSTVAVKLDLGDITVGNFMVVDKAKHTWKESVHSMDLTLIGGEFIV